jgi:arylformamidase
MRITDITGWIYSGMWSYCEEYPGAFISELPQPAFLEGKYRVFCQKFEIGGQSGTYIETKAHVQKSARPVTDYPASDFFFECKVVRREKKGPLEKITVDEIKTHSSGINRGDAVLLNAGWDSKWRDSDYVKNSPYISREAGEWLFARGIKLLGADFPRFDNPKKPEFPWDIFWKKVTFLLAPVVNLNEVKKENARLIALSLKIKGASAVPARAVVVE